MKKERKLLITGCGRSGTKYISELLKQNGYDVGHEEDGADGIASWSMTIAQGEPVWGPSFQEYEFDTIIHQVRNPVKVISSLHTFLDQSWDYIKKYIPIDENDSKLIMCAKYWYYWNLEAEKISQFTYRIEDIDLVLPKIINILGGEKYSEEILEELPRDINKRSHDLIPLEKIRDEDEKLYDNILKLALKYGYRKEEIEEYNKRKFRIAAIKLMKIISRSVKKRAHSFQ